MYYYKLKYKKKILFFKLLTGNKKLQIIIIKYLVNIKDKYYS